MKKIVISFILLVNSVLLFSQQNKGINLNFNWAHSGHNIEASYSIKKNNDVFNIGAKYLLNIPYSNNRFFVFKDRYHAVKFYEHFGLIAEYNRVFNINQSDIKPYMFINIQYLRANNYDPTLLSPFGMYNNYQLYIGDSVNSGPYPVIENNIGIGIKYQLYRNVDFNAKAGAGIGFFYMGEDGWLLPYGWHGEYIIYLFSVGLTYNFN